MTDRGLELRQLGALALELAEQGREADVVLVDECLYAGTWDVPAPEHILTRLRELWESSKASKRMWATGLSERSANAECLGASTPQSATSAATPTPSRVH